MSEMASKPEPKTVTKPEANVEEPPPPPERTSSVPQTLMGRIRRLTSGTVSNKPDSGSSPANSDASPRDGSSEAGSVGNESGRGSPREPLLSNSSTSQPIVGSPHVSAGIVSSLKKVSNYLVDVNPISLSSAQEGLSFANLFTRGRGSTAPASSELEQDPGTKMPPVDVPSVLAALNDNAEDVQLRAAITVCKLAQEEFSNTFVSSDEETTAPPKKPRVSVELGRKSTEIRGEVGNSEDNNKLKSRDGLDPLIKFATTSPSLPMQRVSIEALSQLAADKEKQQWMADAGIAPKLVANLKSSDAYIVMGSLRILRQLSSNPNIRAKLVEDGILDPLLTLLRLKEGLPRVLALKTLSHLALLPDVQEQTVERGGIPALLVLLRDENLDIKRIASRCFYRLALNVKNRSRICDLGGLIALASVVNIQIDDVQGKEGSQHSTVDSEVKRRFRAQFEAARALGLLTATVEDHLDRLKFEVKAAEESARRKQAIIESLNGKLARAETMLKDKSSQVVLLAGEVNDFRERVDSLNAQLKGAVETADRVTNQLMESQQKTKATEEALKARSREHDLFRSSVMEAIRSHRTGQSSAEHCCAVIASAALSSDSSRDIDVTHGSTSPPLSPNLSHQRTSSMSGLSPQSGQRDDGSLDGRPKNSSGDTSSSAGKAKKESGFFSLVKRPSVNVATTTVQTPKSESGGPHEPFAAQDRLIVQVLESQLQRVIENMTEYVEHLIRLGPPVEVLYKRSLRSHSQSPDRRSVGSF